MQKHLPGDQITVCADESEFVKSLPGTQVAIVWFIKEPWLDLADKLEWIITPAAGRDYFSLKPRPGLTVDYSSFHGQIMGETVLGMILAEIRGIRKTVLYQQAGDIWPRDKLGDEMVNFRGSRVTILGFGNIGEWVARLAKPFGVQITGVKRTKIPLPAFLDNKDRIVTIDELDSVLPETDHLVISLPSGEDTTDIIDEERISLLPAWAVVYNVGRGNVIKEEALYKALQEQAIRAVYLDVFKTEPLPENSSLRKCNNLIIMPHASAIAPNYLDLFLDEFFVKYEKKYLKNI